MNLRSTIEKLDQLVELLYQSRTPPREEIRRLASRGLTEKEAVELWRRAVRGRGWTIDSIEEIEDEIHKTIAERGGCRLPITAVDCEA